LGIDDEGQRVGAPDWVSCGGSSSDRRLAVVEMMALPMCRRDIGDYLGLTLETVSRALSQLHTQGILGFSGARRIRLRNRLRNMESCE
jgi:CRP/FNR family nitrogen fixation transcriptional regulator